MMDMTAKNRKDALAWVEGLLTGAATNIYDTLELAFQVGMPGSPVKSIGTPDTIFFLSDGGATAGKFTEPEVILEYVRRMNKLRGVKIHCIGVGDDHDASFLRKLAEQNSGDYVAR
jgi:hypothetical protein